MQSDTSSGPISETLAYGRMITPSKSGYLLTHPDHIVVFNANIFTRTRGPIWCGDLDINVDGDALRAMAAREGDELYILREDDRRFWREPAWDAAVARVTADTITIC